MSIHVGGVDLPDFPPGWPVYLDSETSGIYVDGDPFTVGSRTASPPARVSTVSIAYRRPVRIGPGARPGTVEYGPGDLVSHAWPFDQGPIVGKPGPIKKGVLQWYFDQAAVDKILARFGLTYEQACPNLDLGAYVRLLRWLRQRDVLVLSNAKFDMHIFKQGPRDEIVCEQYHSSRDHEDGLWAALTPAGRTRMREVLADPAGRPGLLLGLDLDRSCPEIRDTMLVQALFEPLESVALKPTARRLWGVDQGREQDDLNAALKLLGPGLTKRYDLLPWFVLGPYATKDAELTARLDERQTEQLATGDHPPNAHELIREDLRTMRGLYRDEQRGVGFRVPECEAANARLRARMSEIAALLPYDPSKLVQIKRYYFAPTTDGGLGYTPLELTEKTRSPKLDEAQVRQLVKDGAPFAAEYDEYSHCSSALSKWYEGWLRRVGPDGRLRTSFTQVKMESDRPGGVGGGAVSGRLAVSRVQLHAIPHNYELPRVVLPDTVRSLICEEGDFDLWEADLPQGEVRIATAVARCRPMYDIIMSGADVHGETAKLVFKILETDPDFGQLRSVSKRVTFGNLYGAGIMALIEQVFKFTGVMYSVSDMKAIVDQYHAAFPEFKKAAYQAQRMADRGLGGPGFVTLFNSRRRWAGPGERTHKFFNQIIQGDLAEAAKMWMNEVEDAYPDSLLLQIHDSLVFRTPRGPSSAQTAQDIADIGSAIYQKAFSTPGMPMPFPMKPELWEAKV